MATARLHVLLLHPVLGKAGITGSHTPAQPLPGLSAPGVSQPFHPHSVVGRALLAFRLQTYQAIVRKHTLLSLLRVQALPHNPRAWPRRERVKQVVSYQITLSHEGYVILYVDYTLQ